MHRTLSRGLSSALVLIAALSCSEKSLTGTDRFDADSLSIDASRVASVTVSLASTSIAVGDTVRATATLRDYSNRLIRRIVVWTSSNTAVATVDSTGLVTGIAPGTAIITATRGTKSGSATLTVGAISISSTASVDSVSVSLVASSLTPGQTTQAAATTYDSAGNVLAGRAISWSSSDNGVAQVSVNGVVTAIAAGTSQIIATSEGKSGSAVIQVTNPPQAITNPGTVTDLRVATVDSTSVTLSFTQVDDGAGQPAKYDVRFAVAPIDWGAAASVTNGGCKTPVVGFAIGATLTCSVAGLRSATKYNFQLVAFRGTLNQGAVFGGLSNIAAATTGAGTSPPPAPVASVSVSPTSPTIQVGASLQLSATTRDSAGNTLTGRVVTWSTANAAIVTVSSSGLVTGVAAGSAQITATSEGQSGSVTVTVQTAPPPPPPPSGSNEPAGMTLVSDRPFNALRELGWDEPTNGQSSNNVSIMSDGTSPYSAPNFQRITYWAGSSGGSAPWDEDSPGFRYKTLYVSQWVRVSSNWQGHPGSSVNKIFYVYTTTDVPSFYLYLNGSGTGPLRPYIGGQNISQGGAGFGDASNPDWPPNLLPTAQVTRGQWFHIELVAQMNSAGAADGYLDMWLNGLKIQHIPNIMWQSSSPSWRLLHLAPVWGGGGGTVANTMTMDFDHIYLSGKN
jgi:uncharacterized protein YjdB